ncbi:MAG: VOC family protein [Acidobacteria bacterium]|nr:VOC family protein [Acidobacteriota bacterium]
MANKVLAIPEGYHSITPYLMITGAAAAIEFYKKAFGAEELVRMPSPGGLVGHAEIRIGNSMVMLADECDEAANKSPQTLGGTPVTLLIYVENIDAVFQRAVAAGAKVVREPADMFYGDRSAGVTDPFGHSWYIHTHIEDVSPEEMGKRLAAMHKT